MEGKLKEKEKNGQIPGTLLRTRKAMEHEVDSDTLGIVIKSLKKRIEELEMKGKIETIQITAWLE